MASQLIDSLTIVIPALDEQDAIEGTITRCLEARDYIQAVAGITDIEIIVVSDGSTDRTAEIAQQFDEVHTIVFPENRGYGAAIKEGWSVGRGELLAFLDADGTCDPLYFGEMCQRAIDDRAEVVLGSRLGPESQMPKIRRIGNRIYACLLGLLCGHQVTDTASGMRVVRRSALKFLYPLPDGLHFTPSMSARALLNDLRVIEIPMRYEERIGTSKLSVLRDGVRFLATIFAGVLCYRPEKIFLSAFCIGVLAILLLGAYPMEFYIQNHRLNEWMIYRFVVCSLVGSGALLLLLATALANRMAHFGPRRREAASFWPGVICSLLDGWGLVAVLLSLSAVSLWSLWPGIAEYAMYGTVSLHWSRLLAGAFALLSMFQTGVFAVLMKVTEIWQGNQQQLSQYDAQDVHVDPRASTERMLASMVPAEA